MMRWRTYTDRLIVLAVILAAWQVGSFLIGPYWLSSPGAVTARFCAQIWNGELIRHGGYTVEEALIGTLDRRRAGGAAAVPAAAPSAWSRSSIPSWSAAMAPPSSPSRRCSSSGSASASRSKIALVAGVVFFIVYFNTLSGVRALDPRLVRWRRSPAPASGVARHVVLPAAVPHILAGFRIAVPYAIGGAIIAELISSNRGLGYLVQTGAMNFDTTSVFSAILAATLVVHAANWLLNAAERTLLRWRPPAQAMLDAEN